jgi:hypothetical protein
MRELTEETNPPDPQAARTPPRRQGPVITAPAPAAAAPNLQPLSQTNAVGRRVLVPADIYPAYRCSEQQGRGWECTVMTASSLTAKVRFTTPRAPQTAGRTRTSASRWRYCSQCNREYPSLRKLKPNAGARLLRKQPVQVDYRNITPCAS